MFDLVNTRTNSWDGLHELVLFQLEEDGGFPGSIEPQGHDADLHLWADVDPVVLTMQHMLIRLLLLLQTPGQTQAL